MNKNRPMRLLQPASALAVAMALTACSASNEEGDAASSRTSPDASVPSTTTSKASKDPRMAAWKDALSKSPPSTEGCFHTSYPSTTWVAEPCAPAPTGALMPDRFPTRKADGSGFEMPFDKRRGGGASAGNAGNGPDFILKNPSTIESAVGSFPSVVGATSATSVFTDGGVQTPNGFSVQMNSNTFPLTSSTNQYCQSSSGCTAWQQAIYSNIQGWRGILFEYWLLNYLNQGDGGPTQCPGPGTLGVTWGQSKNNCVVNSPLDPNVPASLPITDLSQIAVWVEAGLSADGGSAGNNDILMFGLEGTNPPATAQAWAKAYPSVLGLQTSWNQVEFGVFGDLNLTILDLPANTTIETEVQSTPVYPNVTCLSSGGTTGEQNNLNMIVGSDGNPDCCVVSGGDISFLESNVPGQSCSLCGAQDQPCCAVGVACNNSYDYCEPTTNTCEEIEDCPGGCPSGYICEAPNGPPGVCVVNHRCKFPDVYCASTRTCIPEGSYCPR
jgi:hypothetical protein